MEAKKQEVTDPNARFGLVPQYRIAWIATGTSLYGIFSGFYRGFADQSSVYLAENSHRLPKTVGGWYFYHKRKNYVCIKEGLVQGVKRSITLSMAVTGYFTLEALFDEYKGVNFGSSAAATTVSAFVYSRVKRFSKFQTRHLLVRALAVGLVSGIAQDAFIWGQGGKGWWMMGS